MATSKHVLLVFPKALDIAILTFRLQNILSTIDQPILTQKYVKDIQDIWTLHISLWSADVDQFGGKDRSTAHVLISVCVFCHWESESVRGDSTWDPVTWAHINTPYPFIWKYGHGRHHTQSINASLDFIECHILSRLQSMSHSRHSLCTTGNKQTNKNIIGWPSVQS